jgi:predicted RNA-binding Zn-ribbon protein involved in translation (DUF1610 family)
MIDRKVLEAMINGQSSYIESIDTETHHYDFDCPKCGSSHFGSVYRGNNSTYHCHDEYNCGCKWSGSKKECFVLSKNALVQELLLAYDKINELENK